MTDISTIAGHIVEIAYGIAVACTGILLLYAVGISIVRCVFRNAILSKGDIIVIGTSTFVAWCWYGVGWGVPIGSVVNYFACSGTLFFLMVLLCTRRVSVADVVDWQNDKECILGFVLLYAFIYGALFPWYSNDNLPILYYANNDVFNYINCIEYLQTLVPRVAGADFPGAYGSTPGAMHLFELTAKFYGDNALAAAFPFLIGTLSLIGVGTAQYLRKVFLFGPVVSWVVVVVLLTGGLFRYISANYFLSQLVCSAVVLQCLYKTLDVLAGDSQKRRWLQTALIFFPYNFLLLYLYPVFFIVTGIAQASVIVAYGWQEYREDARRVGLSASSWPRLIRHCLWWGSALAVAAAGAAIVDARHSLEVVQRILLLSNVGLFGWPLDLISPTAVVALPGPLYSASVRQTVVLLFAWALCVALCLYAFRAAEKTSLGRKRAALYATFAVMVVVYIAYYFRVGASYVQWKFASYGPLLFSFVAWGAASDLFRRLLGRWTLPKGKLLVGGLTVAGLIGLLGANLLFCPPEVNRPFVRYSKKYKNLESISDVATGTDMYVSMSSMQSTFLSVFFIRDLRLHLTTPSYYSMEQVDFSRISRSWPLFVEGAQCDEGDGLVIPSLGCLYFNPPGLHPGKTYKFSESRAEISGLGFPENWGVWNNDTKVALTLRASDQVLSALPQGYINLELVPFVFPGSLPQRTNIHVGSRDYRVTVRAQSWISIPFVPEDWSGQSSRKSEVVFGFPDAVAPREIDSTTTDSRKLAVGFVSLSLTAQPAGKVVTEQSVAP